MIYRCLAEALDSLLAIVTEKTEMSTSKAS